MGPDDFRRIALGMPGTIESAHMGHPDFRVVINGRIFATLKADNQFGALILTPEQQQRFLQEDQASFAPESGAWGRAGSTRVRLDCVNEDVLGEALTLAWQGAANKSGKKRPTTPKPANRRRSKKPVTTLKPRRAVKARRSSGRH